MEVLLAAWIVLLQSAGQQDGSIPSWVERLSSDDPAERDDAVARLRRAGRAAWPALELAVSSPDPETSGRARRILASTGVRRRLSFRVIDSFPGAEAALLGGTTAARAGLARAMAGHLEESREFLLGLLDDPDPETSMAAAESLSEGRTTEWAPRMLDLLAQPSPPRPSRIVEMLAAARRSLEAEDLRDRFLKAPPEGRARLLELSAAIQMPFPVDDDDVIVLLRAPETRAGVIEWIVAGKRREFAATIEEQLDASAPDVVQLLGALRRLNQPVAAGRLAPLLRHKSEEVREQALQMLGDDFDAATDSMIESLLGDPSSTVRRRALQALERRKGAAARERMMSFYLAQDGDPRELAAVLLCRRRDWSAGQARALLRDSDPGRRLRGADLLSRIEGLAAVRDLASDLDESVRRWLLGRAMASSDETAVAMLRRFAGDPDPAIRFDALRALARGGLPDDVEALAPYLDSPEFSFRYPAVEIYLRQAGEKSRDLMKNLLDDPDPSMQCLAIAALHERASPEAAPRAVRFLTSPDAALRRTAGMYIEQAVRCIRDAGLVAQVADLLDRLDGDALAHAAAIVTTYGSAKQSAAVSKLLGSGRAPSEQRAVDALFRWNGAKAFADCLTEERASLVLERLTESVKVSPLDAETETAVGERLRLLVSSRSVRARRAIAQYIPEIAVPEAGAIVTSLLGDRDASVRYAAIRAARRMALPVAPRLRAMLDDEDPEIRLAAAMALDEMDDQDRSAIDEMLAREECDWVVRRVNETIRR